MLRNLLPFIIIIIIAQIVGYIKKQQRKAQQQQTQPSPEQNRNKPQTRSKIEDIIEIFTTDPKFDEERTALETSGINEEEQIIETSPEKKTLKFDDEFIGSEITSSRDEESFDKEKTLSKGRQKYVPAKEKTKTEAKPKPVTIAGMPLTPKNITQGIVISQILKRPDFK